ncbi:SDR family oxidoreductase [Rhodopila sp.]|jgi:NAD(P)-dependent dehydrogenase (short-subunit alcohol dehydrogenase family)|uniref:SDR family oxidoreductase n=1 Tax=Rhodopila sp. TaxID=2480087 RepID=UPI002CFC9736|nr:SDR family oxidoreductase [Rhodopila sp.]HVZ06652.1 SDR family oxidoreductase [Rhodopila sp.]
MSDRIPAGIPRTALVTGAAQRLGREMALELARAGFDIAIHYHASQAEAARLQAELTTLNRRSVLLSADLADEVQVETLMPAAVAALGPIGVLINNASRFEREEWTDVNRASWDRHIEPNLRAPFVLTQAFAKALPCTAQGVVINMLDQRVWALTPHFVSYTVSKAALWALTQTMALALAPRIRVNAIGPGPALPSLRQTAAQFAAQCESTPLRVGTNPAEVARALLAILSLPAMTGQMIALDGGQHLQWSPEPNRAGLVE